MLTHQTSIIAIVCNRLVFAIGIGFFSLLIHYTQLDGKPLKIATVIRAHRQLWQLYVAHCTHDCLPEFVTALY